MLGIVGRSGDPGRDLTTLFRDGSFHGLAVQCAFPIGDRDGRNTIAAPPQR